MNTTNNNKSFFTSLEARVIACLMEKQLTTPNNYPLTQNSLMLACNQKSNREPVMELTAGQVGHTVNVLKDRDLVEIDYSGRSNHIGQRVMGTLNLNKNTQAILTVLMVRAPLTLNDIKARTSRMVDFEDINEIQQNLDKMMEAEIPLVVRIQKSAGSREDRFTHLLCGEVSTVSKTKSMQTSESHSQIGKRVNITQRIKLEDRVKILEEKVESLMKLLD